MRHRPGNQHEGVPQFSANSTLGEVDRVKAAQICVIKKRKFFLSPIQCNFDRRPPCSSQPDIERYVKAVFRPIPNFTGKKSPCNRQKQSLKLTVDNFLPGVEG